jgi:phosphoribosylformylglycinamidine synthase
MAVVGNKGVEIIAPLNDAKDIFSETLSRAIVEVSYENEEAFENLVSSVGQYCIKIGKVQGDTIIINGVTKSLEDARNIYFNRFKEVIEQDL